MSRAARDPYEELLDLAADLEAFTADYGPAWQGLEHVITSGRNVPRQPAACSFVVLLMQCIRRVQSKRPDLERFDFARFNIREGDKVGAWIVRCVSETEKWLGLPSADEPLGPHPPHREDPSRARAGSGA